MDRRTAETPVASTVHHPFGSPAGPGLFHHKGLQLPAYIQNVAHAFKDLPESEAIARAIGVVRDWAEGRTPDGKGHVHPDVQAAAIKAIAEWEADKAASGGGKRRDATVAEYRADLSTADINDLPDSAFAHIEPGGSKDSEGKTTPRSLRHYPVHDAPHARNARARAMAAMSSDNPAAKAIAKAALPKINAAAAKFNIGADRAAPDAGDAERRYTPGGVEVRAGADGPRIGGYGAVFGKLSRNLGGFVERVDSGAFNQARSLGWPSVVARYNHDPNMVLGTTAGRTLELRTDNVGLDYSVLPPQSRADILELVGRGDIQFSSFAFRCQSGGDDWGTTDQNYPMRTLHDVVLVDVAPVLSPAYPDATAGLRSLAERFAAPLDEVRSLADADELRRFFTRTDRPSAPVKPKVSGITAMMALMEKRRDPYADKF